MFTTQRALIFILSTILIILSLFFMTNPKQDLSLIAIANYGPHASLEETIKGFKEEMTRLGYKEGEKIQYKMDHVNFDPTLIIPMLTQLKAKDPKFLLALTTPVAQSAKNIFQQKPIVFADITDPIQAGLLEKDNEANELITGASERHDLNAFLDFVHQILPNAKRVGMLYASGESNDLALLRMMKEAAQNHQMEVVAFSVDQPRDVPLRVQSFKDKVDFIYVGTSGPIQPSLPAIVQEANLLKIPVFNADADAVKKHLVLASFGVSFYQIGVNAAKIAAQILEGKEVQHIPPVHPQKSDHHAFISKKQAEKFGFTIPPHLVNTTIVE